MRASTASSAGRRRSQDRARRSPRRAGAGLDVVGPLPADTLFFRAIRGDFDLVVAMYHDQGHCPVKVLGLESGVNITIGLPVVRTSVDHGTAFDIAGTGVADERSLLEALRQAAELSAGEGGSSGSPVNESHVGSDEREQSEGRSSRNTLGHKALRGSSARHRDAAA